MDKILNNKIKDEMIVKINNIKDESSYFPKDDVVKNIDKQGKIILFKKPQKDRSLVLSNLQQQ